jgi:hypothetical protein
MIPAAIVFLYLAAVVYIGIFAFRRASITSWPIARWGLSCS